MIPRAYIAEWQKNAPWRSNAQVEQDLIIERALIELFSDELINQSLAFRGGTALHKIFLPPQVRYSEDIDLVQIEEGEIGAILTRIRKILGFLDKKPRFNRSIHNNTLVFRFNSEIEPIQPLKLKIEINCREHFSVLGWNSIVHSIESSYFRGEAKIVSYKLEELLGTKLRALFQRRKGRDLFDLSYALKMNKPNIKDILGCYHKYMKFSDGKTKTAKEFIINMDEKMEDDVFLGDMKGLLRPEVKFSMLEAYDLVKKELIENI
jgi:predicted nucleotidyltransferase component of viral defense system